MSEEAAEVAHRYAVAEFRDTSLGNAYFNLIGRRELSVEEHYAVVQAVGQAMSNLNEEHETYWRRVRGTKCGWRGRGILRGVPAISHVP